MQKKHYKSGAELKALARGQLLGHYRITILAFSLLSLIQIALTMVTFSNMSYNGILGAVLFYATDFILTLIIQIFTVGGLFLFLKLAIGQPIQIRDIFQGFRTYPDKIIKMEFVLLLAKTIADFPQQIFNQIYTQTGNSLYFMLFCFSLVVSLLFSMWITLTYGQAFYLLLDFPEYDWQALLRYSKRLMKGNKLRLFSIYLSFVPLLLLSTLSCGFALFWILPYMRGTLTNFFLDLMKNQEISTTTSAE